MRTAYALRARVLQSALPSSDSQRVAQFGILHAQAAQSHRVIGDVYPHAHRLQLTSHCKSGMRSCARRMLPLKRFVAGNTKPAKPVAYVCAASAPDLDIIGHGLIMITVEDKVKQERQHAVRFLIDTGATESCIAEAFVHGIGAPARSKLETLSMANGSLAHSKGTVVLPINMQDDWSEAVLKVFPMNSNFDVILGRDWCNYVSCDILYSVGLVKFQSPSTSKLHEIYITASQSWYYLSSHQLCGIGQAY